MSNIDDPFSVGPRLDYAPPVTLPKLSLLQRLQSWLFVAEDWLWNQPDWLQILICGSAAWLLIGGGMIALDQMIWGG